MSQVSREFLVTTTARMAALRLKTANSQIFRALLRLGSATLLVRLMGMLSQIVISGRYGAGALMDAFFIASALPTLLGQLAAGTIESSAIPIYARIRIHRKQEASKLFSTILNLLLLVTALLTLGMLVFPYQMIHFSAPGLSVSQTDLAAGLAPFIFPVLILMAITSYLESILNAEGQFGWPAYAGLLVPVMTGVLVFLMGKSLGIIALCIGMLLGYCLQLGVVLIRARRAGLVYRPIIDIGHPEVRAMLIAIWPLLLGGSIGRASPLIDQIFASTLTAGSISAISYSLKLVSVPVGVIFVSAGRAALPYLSRQASINDMHAFKGTLRLYLWAVAIGTIVLSVLMWVLAYPIVQILFQRGAFSADDTARTAYTLEGFVLGLVPMAAGFITSKAFSALGKTKVLMAVSIYSMVANAVFDYIFARWWQSFGIALATSAVYLTTMIILLVTLRRMIGKLDLFTPPPELLGMLRKIGIGASSLGSNIWEEPPFSFTLPHRMRRQLARISIILGTFALGVAGVVWNATVALRASLGAVIVLILLRYPYLLLLAWVLLDAFIGGSAFPYLQGHNLDTGLTVPTLLLLAYFSLRVTFKRMPTLYVLLFYLLWVLGSIIISPLDLATFLKTWTLRLDYLAVAVLTINIVTTERRLRRLIDLIMFVSAFVALYGIYGYFTKKNGVVDATDPSLFRIASVFGYAAPTLALFLSVVIPLAIYRAFTLRRFKMILGIVLCLILLAALGLTFTRSALISLPLGLVLMVFFLPSRNVRRSLGTGVLVLISVALLLAIIFKLPIFTRFFSTDVLTLNGRTYLWEALLSHFDPTQLLGQGLNASDYLLANLHVGIGGGVIGTAPHSIFLGSLYDHGIIGATLLITVFVSLFVTLLRGARKAAGSQRMLFAVGLAAYVNMALQSLDSSDMWIQAVGLYFWVIVALPFALCWSKPAPSPVADGQDHRDNHHMRNSMTVGEYEHVAQ